MALDVSAVAGHVAVLAALLFIMGKCKLFDFLKTNDKNKFFCA